METMKEVRTSSVLHIISEPGDATHYDYIVHRIDQDEFTIAPARSTFKFPQRINYYTAMTLLETDDEEVWRKTAQDLDTNPFTLMEVCRTIKEIWKGEVG